ncbi:MAG: hypothetical protein NWE78_02455 [Candidatus Bathyarchaeota archaeon]|nr:hypothetical protein [Candidatus Bathyarchaeota archaeon]
MVAPKCRKVLKLIAQSMTKKIVLNIPDDNYKELASLGDYYRQDVEKVAASLLDNISVCASMEPLIDNQIWTSKKL